MPLDQHHSRRLVVNYNATKMTTEPQLGSSPKRHFLESPFSVSTRNNPRARVTHIGALLDVVAIGKGAQETSLRPRQALGDKTPAANLRQITLNIGDKGNQSDMKPLAFVDDALPQSVTRPSASRKSLKTPRFSVEKINLFKTPEPSGKAHWDVSDIDMSMEQTQESIVEECYDEPDYMPPTAISRPSSGDAIIVI